LDGYIPGSIPMKSESLKEASLPLIEETVVYVLDEIDDVSKTEEILKKFGIQNFKCYLDGMESWIKFGGIVEFPRFIRFKALQQSLERNSILLIDVRNVTELNKVGQIPGSECLPLHQINLGFALTDEQFASRYGFLKPDSAKSQNIILTCRSGRRVLVADKILKRKGYLNLRIYSGSFKDWVKNRGTIIKDSQEDLDYF